MEIVSIVVIIIRNISILNQLGRIKLKDFKSYVIVLDISGFKFSLNELHFFVDISFLLSFFSFFEKSKSCLLSSRN